MNDKWQESLTRIDCGWLEWGRYDDRGGKGGWKYTFGSLVGSSLGFASILFSLFRAESKSNNYSADRAKSIVSIHCLSKEEEGKRQDYKTHFLASLCDMFVHNWEISIHLSKRFHHCRSVGCILTTITSEKSEWNRVVVKEGGVRRWSKVGRTRTSSLAMPVSKSSTARLYAWAAIAPSEVLSAAP